MKIDIFFLQEHMHLKANLYKITKHFPDFESFLLPATKKNNAVYSGRPSGGIGIFWIKSMNNSVRIIKHPDSSRVQGIELLNKFIIINTYFPTDPNVVNFDDLELLKCIQDIKWYMDKYSHHEFIIAGEYRLFSSFQICEHYKRFFHRM